MKNSNTRVIVVDENGNKTEFNNFILYTKNKEGNFNESIINMSVVDRAYVSKRLEAKVAVEMCDQIREENILSDLKSKYNK